MYYFMHQLLLHGIYLFFSQKNDRVLLQELNNDALALDNDVLDYQESVSLLMIA